MSVYYLTGFVARANGLIASLEGRITEIKSSSLFFYPELREYCDRRLAVSDPVTAGEQVALQRFLYDPYPDGTGGALAVASFLNLFSGNNAGLFPLMGSRLIGQTVPLAGNRGLNLTPYNGTDASRRNTGIQGNGSLWLETAIVSSTINFSSCYAFVSVSVATGSTQALLADGTGYDFGIDIGSTGSLELRSSDTVDSSRIIFKTGIGAGSQTFSINCTDLVTFSGFHNNILIRVETDLRTQSTNPAKISLLSRSGARTSSSLLRLGAIASQSLTNQQQTALFHASSKLNEDRELLP